MRLPRSNAAVVLVPVLLIGQILNAHRVDNWSNSWVLAEVSMAQDKGVQTSNASTCSLDQVLARTGNRVQEFVSNVNRITAVEVLVHERLDKNGKVKKREQKKFNYVALVKETNHGEVTIEEFRNGMNGNFGFPGEMAVVGMPSLALVFHADHRDEFDMKCEGPVNWHNRQVWAVQFHQKKDKPARMCQIRTKDRAFEVPLMGTAMIDAKSYQVVHLEVDLAEPIPEIRLQKQHQVLDYGPVWFEKDNTTLWLPHEADIVLDSSGKQFHQRHTFTDFRLFAVDYGQQISAPQGVPPAASSPTSNPTPN